MIHAGNLNSLWTALVAVLGATHAVNVGEILSPLEPRRGQMLARQPGLSKVCAILILLSQMEAWFALPSGLCCPRIAGDAGRPRSELRGEARL
jgi:hypothetical protein